MTRLLAIARNAFVEMTRQPIYGLLIFVTFAMLVLDVPLSSWTMGAETAEYRKTDQQLLVNLGLSTLLGSGLLISAFGAAGVVSREIRDRTILTVLSKPLPRAMVVLGKFLGVAAGVTVAYWLCSVAFLMTVRHGVMPTVSDKPDVPVIVLGCTALAATIAAATFCNYFLGWHFISSAVGFALILLTAAAGILGFVGKGWVSSGRFAEGIPWSLPAALLLLLYSHLVFAAVAVAASTRLGQAMTLVACFAFFLVGIWGSYLFAAAGAAGSPARSVVPDLKFFYALDAMVQEKPIPREYVALAGAYAACLVVAVLAVGVALFQTRELEETSSGAPLGVSILAVLGRVAAVGLALAAVAALTRHRGLRAAGAAGVLLAAGVAGWLFWGWFGRGVKWTYFVVLLLAGAGGASAAAGLAGAEVLARAGKPALVADAVGAAVGVLILLLPRTRYHFGLIRTSRRHPPAA